MAVILDKATVLHCADVVQSLIALDEAGEIEETLRRLAASLPEGANAELFLAELAMDTLEQSLGDAPHRALRVSERIKNITNVLDRNQQMNELWNAIRELREELSQLRKEFEDYKNQQAMQETVRANTNIDRYGHP